jgi:hypothetical protein
MFVICYPFPEIRDEVPEKFFGTTEIFETRITRLRFASYGGQAAD